MLLTLLFSWENHLSNLYWVLKSRVYHMWMWLLGLMFTHSIDIIYYNLHPMTCDMSVWSLVELVLCLIGILACK